jgi:hypothetical protein
MYIFGDKIYEQSFLNSYGKSPIRLLVIHPVLLLLNMKQSSECEQDGAYATRNRSVSTNGTTLQRPFWMNVRLSLKYILSLSASDSLLLIYLLCILFAFIDLTFWYVVLTKFSLII